ncbi:MAG TPA: right-handed parallel beta-helix repeat-containing protein [Pyrinomonadaceae bacterium]|nr:right-handed parallel beta-helix repeat-containing protein [Pyrinomonadaceae bacterium]
MNKFRFTIKLMAIAIFMFAFASMAQAQATRTWVSGVGDDANPCSRTAPCKTFAGAISKTAACGEISVLDPGGFGAVTITKSITIDGTGTLAGILSAGVNAIVINVAATTDVVTIRGLTIDGACTGLNGIRIVGNMPKAVNIEDCVIFRFSGLGIDYAATAGTLGHLNVRNSVIRDNVGDALGATTSAGQVKGTLTNSSFTGSGNGVHAKINSRLTAEHCNFSGSTSNGVLADGGTGVIRISNSTIHDNAVNGVSAPAGGVVGINSCDIYNNLGTGALASGGGEVDTYGNNRILANGTDLCATCTAKTPN